MSETTRPAGPDDIEPARARLYTWLTEQAPAPELAPEPGELDDWEAQLEEEFVVFIPPGIANRLFLVSARGVTTFAPSEQSIDEVLAAARTGAPDAT